MKLARIVLALSLAVAPALTAQQPPAPTTASTATVKLPTFDVISVKVNNSGSRNTSMGSNGDSLYVTNVPIQLILKQAFFANDDQIVGAPAWAQSTRFDINAKIAGADLDAFNHLPNDQRKLMIVQILAARFQFAYHRETRMLPEYALVIAKGGPRLQPAKPSEDPDHPQHSSMSVSNGLVTARNVTLAPLVHYIAERVGRPIEDKTGLAGGYDFSLQLGDEHDGPPRGPDPNATADAGPSIFTALQEQLGLKLEAQKGAVEVLVIDRLEMPAAN